MIQKVFILLFLANLTLAQDPLLYCNLAIIEERCTCNFVIFNPAGFNNLTITANPAVNCTLNEVVDATGSGMTKNVPSVLCNALPKLEMLRMEKLAVDNFGGNPFRYCYNLKRLHLSGNAITAIPAYAFSNTALETLNLDNNKITNINFVSFDGLLSLETLDLRDNNLANLDDDVFDHLENLKELDMSHCMINNLKPRLFQHLGELRELDLSGNEFRTIQPSLFSSLTKLESLNLAYCGLFGADNNTFQNNTELLRLNMQNNGFGNLSSIFFASQQKLTELILSNNSQIVITPQLLKPLVLLKIIGMSSNNINQITSSWFESMKILEVVDLSNNVITDIPDHTFSAANGIESLNLANNQILTLNSRSFGSLEKLRNLIVNNNNITKIDHHFISQATDLLTVNFEANNCTDYRTENFHLDRSLYMDAMKNCFDNFDKINISITTENSTIYDWYSIRSNDGWDALEVFVKTNENAHIALTDALDKEIPPIEIQIGQDRNRGSYILEDGDVVFRDPIRNRLDAAGSRFIIGWRFGIVMVFVKGQQFPFMAHTIRHSDNVNFFGLRTLFYDEEGSTADWVVSRIHPTIAPLGMKKIYHDIETRMRSGTPIDLIKYLR